MPHARIVASISANVPERWRGLNFDAVLTNLDLELAQLLVHGRTNSAIATAMNISGDKVKERIRHLFHKTGAERRTHIVVWMYETGRMVPGLPYLHAAHAITRPPTAEQAARQQLATVRKHLTTTRSELDFIAHALDPGHHNRTDRLAQQPPARSHSSHSRHGGS
ncbi:LuxR C-terminal-related transcriptional regulator [Saccharopolyspora sp. NFXS83]|uniref:response regulator transcription factor n=1 Tax=Saccharopolyspora sp. NFXS83 TaxID=2993560 RepID=UPI00224B8FDF|nr:LuxR C-terminal-related transcriptional regulator [Saccharopolyspora sp. NFXS83]MCX2729454.1 LuxR C-terminal-related transcriptional regulator [Saccharopolyspora sp. NFXS83]